MFISLKERRIQRQNTLITCFLSCIIFIGILYQLWAWDQAIQQRQCFAQKVSVLSPMVSSLPSVREVLHKECK